MMHPSPTIATLAASRSYVFWVNIMYLRRTTFENVSEDLSDESSKKMVHYANVMADVVTAVYQGEHDILFPKVGAKTTKAQDPAAMDTSEPAVDPHGMEMQELEAAITFGDISKEEYERKKTLILTRKGKVDPPPVEKSFYELADLLEGVRIDEGIPLAVEPHRKITLDGLDSALYKLLVALVEFFAKRKPTRVPMKEFEENTILKELREFTWKREIPNLEVSVANVD